MSRASERPDTAPAKPPKPGIGDVFRALRQPKIAIMLALGFSSGASEAYERTVSPRTSTISSLTDFAGRVRT